MQEYRRRIRLTNRDHQGKIASLVVLRLPTSWHAVYWHSANLYGAVGQDSTERNKFDAKESDALFLERVQLLAAMRGGCDFEYLPVDSELNAF